MRKINLDGVTDPHKYKDLALLFDRPDFQKYLEKLENQNQDDQRRCPDLASYLFHSKGIDLAADIVGRFRYPASFTRAVFFAACFGKVTDDDVINCYSTVLMNPLSALDSYTPTLTKKDLVIHMDPHAIKGNKEAILHEISLLLDGVLQTTEPLSRNHPLNKDPKSDIRRDREWYWMWLAKREKGGGVYNRIINAWNNKCPTPDLEPHDKKCKYCIFDNNIIEQAVSRYHKALSIKIS